MTKHVADVNTAAHTDSCGRKHGAVWTRTWRPFGSEPRCGSPPPTSNPRLNLCGYLIMWP